MRELFLFKVDDHFQITNWGLVIAPGIPLEHYEGPRDIRLLLKKPDCTEIEEAAEIFYSFPKPTPIKKMLTILFPHLKKEDVPIGTEVWFISSN